MLATQKNNFPKSDIPGVTRLKEKQNGRVLACLIGGALSCLFVPAKGRAEGPNLLDRLIPLWKSQHTEIASAHLKYRLSQLGSDDLAPLTANKLDELLTSADLVKDPDALGRIDNILLPTRNLPTPSWTLAECYFEGEKVREAFLADKQKYQVFDGKVKIEYDGVNNQATLFQEGASTRYIPTLDEFRNLLNPNYKGYIVTDQRADEIELSGGKGTPFLTKFVLDSAGMMKRSTTRTQAGQILTETYQDGFVTYPGGVVFPTVVEEATFGAAGTLSWIRITVLEEAQFNTPLPAGTFVAEASKGVNVFDQREKESIKYFKASAPIPNLVVAADERMPPPSPSPASGLHWWLIGGNVLLLLLTAGGWFFWKRRMRRFKAH